MSWRAGLCEQDFSRAGGSQAMESETAASVSRSISNTTLRESAHPLLGCVQSPSLRCGSWARVDVRQTPARRTQGWCFKPNTAHSATINVEGNMADDQRGGFTAAMR